MQGDSNGIVCLWAIVNTEMVMEERSIETLYTGLTVPVGMGIDRRFIGTVTIDRFVSHYLSVYKNLLIRTGEKYGR